MATAIIAAVVVVVEMVVMVRACGGGVAFSKCCRWLREWRAQWWSHEGAEQYEGRTDIANNQRHVPWYVCIVRRA
jgi:hypothetical protein